MPHIFISYSRNNSDCVQRTVQRLEARGYHVWFDKQSIPGGAAWKQAIREGIREAAVMVLFWSADSAASTYVGEEIQLALNKQIGGDLTLITLWLDDTRLSDDIRDYNALPFADCEATGPFNNLLKQLPASVRRQTQPFVRDLPLKEQSQAQALTTTDLIRVPLMRSAYGTAYVLGEPDSTLKATMSAPLPHAALFIEALGRVDDEQFVRGVYADFRQKVGATHPALALYITGPAREDGTYALPNDVAGAWMDTATLAEEAARSLFGRGGLLLDTYLAAPAVLSFAIGARFGDFWQMRLNNYEKAANLYHPVVNLHDMGPLSG